MPPESLLDSTESPLKGVESGETDEQYSAAGDPHDRQAGPVEPGRGAHDYALAGLG